MAQSFATNDGNQQADSPGPQLSLDALRCTFFLGVGFLIGLFMNSTEEGERRFVQRLRETLDQIPTKILTIYTLRRVWRQFLDENEDT